VYSSLQLIKKYLHYYSIASNSKGHGIHSPFVYNFIQNVLNNKRKYYPTSEIEYLRKEMLNNQQKISVEDYGAGSRKNSTNEKKINEIAKTAVKSKKYAQLLFRLAKQYQPQTILELGTSLGITTCYLAKANSAAHIITIEGSKSIAELAQSNFNKLQLNNISLLQGNFDDLLPSAINGLATPIDLAYIDGNHRYNATINYFNLLLQKTNTNTIMVFDDIHWSREMERAWHQIKQHPSVLCTIDIFFLGFIFFRKEFKQKQHFTIRF
jgi:predicted O-methyltransferase YrrM